MSAPIEATWNGPHTAPPKDRFDKAEGGYDAPTRIHLPDGQGGLIAVDVTARIQLTYASGVRVYPCGRVEVRSLASGDWLPGAPLGFSADREGALCA